MNCSDIVRILKNNFDTSDFEIELVEQALQPYVKIKKHVFFKIASFLNEYPKFFFDTLISITAIDNGSANENRFELVYHFYSIINEIALAIHVDLSENELEIESLVSIWKTAEWHERECFDLMGIKFKNHPDLRRILLPADWVGYPLRKDFEDQEFYHGLKIKSD